MNYGEGHQNIYTGSAGTLADHSAASVKNLRGLQDASVLPSRPTLCGAIATAEQVHSFLLATADVAEEIAGSIGGARPPSASENSDKRRGPESLVEVITDRVEMCRDPASRIRNALERIKLAVG